jgi:hypothetical protein
MPALVACVLTVMLATAASASAAVRYAAPGASGPSPCLRSDPCPLYVAIAEQAPHDERAESGDEAILLPGVYKGVGDLGPTEQLNIILGITVRGSGVASTTIEPEGQAALVGDEPGDVLSDLRIRSDGPLEALTIGQGTAERVISEIWTARGIACTMRFRAVLVDSACISHGAKGAGVGQRTSEFGTPSDTRTISNVTAIGAGPESAGLLFDIEDHEVFTFVDDTIAEGTAVDVEARGGDAGGGSAIALENSDYDTTNAVGHDEGEAEVTPAGSGTNITAEPLLAADQIHELPTSPTVDAGAPDTHSGAHDVFGAARSVGAAPDIGADELLGTTATALECPAGGVLLGEESSCLVRVTAADGSALSGGVELVDPTSGARTACQLEGASSGSASCAARFQAATVGPTMALRAEYTGDQTHAASSGEAEVALALVPTRTEVSCNASVLPSYGSMVCAATVADESGTFTPTGTVLLSGERNIRPEREACTLHQVEPGRAICALVLSSFVPVPVEATAVETGGSIADGVRAEYGGDAGHLPSAGGPFAFTIQWSSGGGLDRSSPNSRPAPATALRHHPPHRTRSRQVSFAFGSGDATAHFRCRVDRAAFRPCTSPYRIRVRPGHHVFEVEAVSRKGVVDPTPARFAWTVVGRAR